LLVAQPCCMQASLFAYFSGVRPGLAVCWGSLVAGFPVCAPALMVAGASCCNVERKCTGMYIYMYSYIYILTREDSNRGIFFRTIISNVIFECHCGSNAGSSSQLERFCSSEACSGSHFERPCGSEVGSSGRFGFESDCGSEAGSSTHFERPCCTKAGLSSHFERHCGSEAGSSSHGSSGRLQSDCGSEAGSSSHFEAGSSSTCQ